MICPYCRKPMMKYKRVGSVYYWCTWCAIEIESTSE